jgi:hypothetical protein
VSAFGVRASLAALTVAVLSVAPADVARPRDPWIYRCELDGRPRALVLALQTDLWLVYDAESCSLVRATRGDPQRGAKDWLTDHGGGVWWLARDGRAASLQARYLGFEVREGHAVLHFELLGADGERIAVDETSEFVRATELAEDPTTVAPWLTPAKFALRRTLQARGVPAGAQLSLVLACDLRHAQGNFLAENLRDSDEVAGTAPMVRLTGRLPFEGAVSSNEILLFFDPATSMDAKR